MQEAESQQSKIYMHTWILLAAATLLVGTHGYVSLSNNMNSFSSAIKGGPIEANVEKLLYERNTGQPGVITEQWCAGTIWPQCHACLMRMNDEGNCILEHG